MTERRNTKGFLIVRSSGEMRVVKNKPTLGFDEVAFPVTVTIPITWGRVQPVGITLDMPEPPAALIDVGPATEPDQ